MIDEKIKKYEPFFGKWRISKEVGKGAFGQVYEIYWEDDVNSQSLSALKYIHIPSEEALREQRVQQPNREAVRNYFLRQVERIKDEIRILQKCKGHSNIVSYEDHMIIENGNDEEIGWDILIRMELLYPLNKYLSRKDATQYDVIKLWLDISNALIFCDEQNIIHRDIKPANILMSSVGNYKLSDFGVARKNMQQDMAASTRVGTEKYMAPEVFKNEKYDKRADYYSLGCVIYYLLNKNRHAFYPPYPQEVDYREAEQADERRRKGEKIPPIPWVSKEINAVLLKSMAYHPARRYKNAKEMYQAVQMILEKQENELKQRPLFSDIKDHHVLSVTTKKKTEKRVPGRKKKASHNTPIIVACVFLLMGVSGIVYAVMIENQSVQIVKKPGEIIVMESQFQTESQNLIEQLMEELEPNTVITEAVTEEVTTEEMITEEVTTEEVTTEEITTEEVTTEEVTTEEMTTEEVTTEEVTTEEITTEEVTTEEVTTEEVTTEEATTEEVTTETITEEATTEEVTTETVTEEATTEEVTTEEVTTEEVTTEEETTEAPIPEARLYGSLERPLDEEQITNEIKVKGWILINDSVEEMEVYLNLVKDGEVVKTIEMTPKEMGENTFEKRRQKNAADIAAAAGYEIKGSESIGDVSEGTYLVQLCVVEPKVGTEEILDQVEINIAEKEMNNSVGLMDFMGLTEESSDLDTHYIYEEQGFALGLDEAEEYRFPAEQIVLTGWINAEENASLGAYLEVDSTLYTADSLAEAGGSLQIVRASRNLEDMDKKLIGKWNGVLEEAGYIMEINLPFLEAGKHTISLTMNVGITSSEPQMVDIKPLVIIVDPAMSAEENAAEKIIQKWAKELPESETEKENETDREE